MIKKFFTRENLPWVVFLILVSVAVGIILASGLDLPSRTLAGYPAQAAGQEKFSGHSPFVAVAARVKDAVVNISAEKVVGRRPSFFDQFFFYPHPGRAKYLSLGSGFIFDQRGYILTNNHVISGADNIQVKLSDESVYEAKIVGADPATDIAVLKIKASRDLPSVVLGNSDSIFVGDWAIAVGNPFPQQGLDRTVTVGVISAKGRSNLVFGDQQPVYQDYIQTDAAINHGNSGGPLVNISGEVIGINSAIATSSPDGGNVGVGFAIPINLAKAVLPSLMKAGKVERGWLGLQPRDLTPDLAEALDLPVKEGVLVEQVVQNTPAAQSGLKAGDVILSFAGKKVSSAQEFRLLVAATSPEKTVTLDILRNGRKKTLEITLAKRPEQMTELPQGEENNGAEAPVRGTTRRWLGMTVTTATRDLCDSYDVAYYPGLMVTEVETGSPADNQGIEPGFIITEVAGEKVAAVGDFLQVTEKLKRRSRPILIAVRDREAVAHYVALRPVSG